MIGVSNWPTGTGEVRTSNSAAGVEVPSAIVRTFPRSLGIRRVPEAKLFFQEEFPEVIAEEALRLWRA